MEVVSGDMMNKFGEFTVINKLARDYNYTHAEAFDLPWRVAYTILALDKTQGYIEYRAQELKHEHERNQR